LRRQHSIIDALWPPLVVLVAAVVALQLAAEWMGKPFLLPTPGAIMRVIGNRHRDLLASLWTTAEASLIGFGCSVFAGVGMGMILSGSGLVRRAFYPYTVFFQTVPIVAIAPLLMIWCGPGLVAVAMCSFIVSVFPVIANTLTGMLSTDPALADLFRLYGASGWDRLWKLKLPSALPAIFTGLRVASGLAVIGTVVAEFLVGLLGPGEGLGVRIVSANKQGRTDLVFACVLIASLLGLAMFAGINLAATLLLRRWHASEQDS
jgi:NitT/TauT family transport system permease protein